MLLPAPRPRLAVLRAIPCDDPLPPQPTAPPRRYEKHIAEEELEKLASQQEKAKKNAADAEVLGGATAAAAAAGGDS